MNDDFIAVLFLAGIVQIVFLYYFFKMCSDVTKVKDVLAVNQVDHLSLYTKYAAFGNDSKAREALESYVWSKTLQVKYDKSGDKLKREYYADFRKTYEPKLNALGSSWPDYDIFK